MITKYSDQHEWIRLEDNVGIVGITEYATQQLGDIVYVELPSLGRTFVAGAQVAVVESVKAASEVYTPLSGEVIEINTLLGAQPELVNTDPLGVGWFFKIKIANPTELERLMDEPAYKTFTQESH